MMNYIVGMIFVAVAVIVALFGDRTVVSEGGGHVSKVFAWPKSRASQIKWAIAAALAGVGLWFIIVGIK